MLVFLFTYIEINRNLFLYEPLYLIRLHRHLTLFEINIPIRGGLRVIFTYSHLDFFVINYTPYLNIFNLVWSFTIVVINNFWWYKLLHVRFFIVYGSRFIADLEMQVGCKWKWIKRGRSCEFRPNLMNVWC